MKVLWGAVLWLAVALCGGCAGSFESARDPAAARDREHCIVLDRAHRYWAAGSITLIGLSGGQGLGTIAVEDPDTRKVLAISSVIAAAVAAGAATAASGAAESWARECTNAK